MLPEAQPLRVRKVVVYVTRGSDLLVFRHRDVEAGVQVPAGTVREDESPDAAAARELHEESGLVGVTWSGLVGSAEHDARPDRDEIHDRSFFHATLRRPAPAQWLWFEEHDGEAAPTAFTFFWLPLSRGHLLAAGMGALLSAVPR